MVSGWVTAHVVPINRCGIASHIEISMSAATLTRLASTRRNKFHACTLFAAVRYISGLPRATRRRTSASSTQLPP